MLIYAIITQKNRPEKHTLHVDAKEYGELQSQQTMM
jgi:hypothetical protein